MIFGYLRETSEIANKSGNDPETGLCRTGLEEYLKIIFPEIDDWVHDKTIPNLPQGVKCLRRPDYRSEKLKLIIEFDGLPHYTSPSKILDDIIAAELYNSFGYKVVRIPYFIQLSNKAVEKLFNRKVEVELFNENYPSLGIKINTTPAFLCPAGIKRMAKEFLLFPEQYEVNLKYLEKLNNDYLTGISLLISEMKSLY